MTDGIKMQYILGFPKDRYILLEEKSKIWGGSITHPQTSLIIKESPENLANGQVLSGMESIEPDNWPGKTPQQTTCQTIMEWKKVLTNSPPGSYITTWHQKQLMNALALHTIIIDGVWYPQRAVEIKQLRWQMPLCKCGNVGLQHMVGMQSLQFGFKSWLVATQSYQNTYECGTS
eukprot:11064343-Heterocapsa_arctica.AAC.1